VRAHDVGGGFGIRSDAYAEYCVAMLAAKAIGKPVKWTSSRSETFVSDYHGRAAKLSGELALDKEGRFLAIRINWIVNTVPTFPLRARSSTPASRPSRDQSLSHPGHVRPPPARPNQHDTHHRLPRRRPAQRLLSRRAAGRGGRPRDEDRPLELRRRNLIPKEAFPYQTPHPHSVYDSGDPHGLVDEAVKQAEWKTFDARRAQSKKRGKLRGIGCGVFIEPAGAGGAPKEEAMIKFGESGNALLYVWPAVRTGPRDCVSGGRGEALGMDPEKITLRASDPDGPRLVGEGTIGSRSMMAHGGALLWRRARCSQRHRARRKDLEVARTIWNSRRAATA